jgi:peptidoglycan/xylan/chitin deacetylase (PgdA/CDA1 family)
MESRVAAMPSWRPFKIGAVACAPVIVLGALVALQPDWIVATLAKRSPEVVYSVETQDPVVALTIDDGPDPVVTPKILDVLKRHDARATFFLITSRIPGNEGVVVRMVEEDHELANHLTADEPSIRLAPSDFEHQLLESHDALSKFADVRWFRPGSGWYDAAMLSILHKHGYRCVLGSVYPFDPQLPSSWFAAHYVLWNVRPGSIIVLHDHGARGERTASALTTILPELNRRGFRVVTLSELLEGGNGD